MADIMTLGIPFFFLLAIVYGALEFSGLFKSKAVNGIISIVVAAVSISNAQAVDFINQYLPYAGILFAAFFFLGFLLKSLKLEKGAKKDWPLIMVALGLVVIIFARQGDTLRGLFDRLPVSFDNFVIIMALLIMATLFYAAYKHKGA